VHKNNTLKLRKNHHSIANYKELRMCIGEEIEEKISQYIGENDHCTT
jgi:hypothetical protein